MARMHSRKKGKSGSNKPLDKTPKSWFRYKPKEVEMLILKLGKEGMEPSRIGIELRDRYGIPNTKVLIGKNITQIMREKHVTKDLPEDLRNLIKHSLNLSKHLEINKQDRVAKLGLQLVSSKIRRLVKYYKKTKALPADWKYDAESLKYSLS